VLPSGPIEQPADRSPRDTRYGVEPTPMRSSRSWAMPNLFRFPRSPKRAARYPAALGACSPTAARGAHSAFHYLPLAVLVSLALLSGGRVLGPHQLLNVLYPALAFLLTFVSLLTLRRRWLLYSPSTDKMVRGGSGLRCPGRVRSAVRPARRHPGSEPPSATRGIRPPAGHPAEGKTMGRGDSHPKATRS